MKKFESCKELLLVSCSQAETPEDFIKEIGKYYDQRLEHEWGVLYDIGEKYVIEENKFYHIRTFAGSLILRMFVESKKGTFPRRVAIYSDDLQSWELTQPDGKTTRLPSSALKKDNQSVRDNA